MKWLHRVLAAMVIAAGGFHSLAGDNHSALEALQALQIRIGPDACALLVAMHGEQGQDQPAEWMVLTLNPQSPNLGQEYVIDKTGVVDKGVPPGLYPAECPPGFVDRAHVLVDSPYAFQVLQQAAVRARVGFNSVNYTLIARAYEQEPVWQLEALDVKGRPVGQVDLSAKSGVIYRTVWYYWEGVDAGAAWQGPKVVDSLLAGVMPEQSVQPPLEGQTGASIAGTYPMRTPGPERAKPVAPETKEKEKGGLFSRLRRNTRPLFGPSSSQTPPPAPDPAHNAPEMAPEAGVAVPVPADSSSPTADVAPAVPLPHLPSSPSSGLEAPAVGRPPSLVR